MLLGNRFFTFSLLAILVVVPTACSKKLYTRMKRVAKVAAKPQETRPLPQPQKPTGTTTTPTVEAEPIKEPTREWLGEATLTDDLKKDLVSQGMNPDMNCFQYVYSNYVESIEISTGPCPAVGTKAKWTDIKATIFFYTPDGNPLYDMYVVDPKDSEVENLPLGLLIEDPAKPMSALIGSLCNGSYAGDEEKKGCRIDIHDDGIIHGILVTTKDKASAPAPSTPSTP